MLISMEDCAPSIFSRNWVLVTRYLCFKFRIFNRFILKKFVFQVEGGPHLLQSCFHVAQNDLPPTTKEMHPSLENLVIIGTPNLQASLMDTHHNTSLRSILEDDFIPSTIGLAFILIQARGQGYGWLLSHLSVHFASHTLLSSQRCVFVSV
jgi:hypothetical protein